MVNKKLNKNQKSESYFSASYHPPPRKKKEEKRLSTKKEKKSFQNLMKIIQKVLAISLNILGRCINQVPAPHPKSKKKLTEIGI